MVRSKCRSRFLSRFRSRFPSRFRERVPELVLGPIPEQIPRLNVWGNFDEVGQAVLLTYCHAGI